MLGAETPLAETCVSTGRRSRPRVAEPLITVALQFFNSRSTLETAVRSIKMQTFQDWELILHDDGSTDGGAEAIKHLLDARTRLTTSAVRRGRPACINEAIERARGRYFALMDGDDLAYPERFERQLTFLESHTGVDLLGSPVLVFGRQGNPLGKRTVPLEHAEICRRPWALIPVWQPTFCGRTEWFRRHRYDERRRRAQDQDLLLRSYRTSRFANLPEILVGYREETISLRKSWYTRIHLLRSILPELTRQRRPGWVLRALAGQAAKAAVDALAVLSGLNYRVLRHRARPLSEEEQARWAQVWPHVARKTDDTGGVVT